MPSSPHSTGWRCCAFHRRAQRNAAPFAQRAVFEAVVGQLADDQRNQHRGVAGDRRVSIAGIADSRRPFAVQPRSGVRMGPPTPTSCRRLEQLRLRNGDVGKPRRTPSPRRAALRRRRERSASDRARDGISVAQAMRAFRAPASAPFREAGHAVTSREMASIPTSSPSRSASGDTLIRHQRSSPRGSGRDASISLPRPACARSTARAMISRDSSGHSSGHGLSSIALKSSISSAQRPWELIYLISPPAPRILMQSRLWSST